jgi:hypothetical protein
VTIKDLLDAVAAVEDEIIKTPPGAPELASIVARIVELQGELERTRSVLGPVIPDASSPPSADEKSADDLERALRSLLSAASSKR